MQTDYHIAIKLSTTKITHSVTAHYFQIELRPRIADSGQRGGCMGDPMWSPISRRQRAVATHGSRVAKRAETCRDTSLAGRMRVWATQCGRPMRIGRAPSNADMRRETSFAF